MGGKGIRMNYYQEITLFPNVDIGTYFIWQKLYQQIHLALVESKSMENTSAIGVSFPEYDAGTFSLGTKLRLFADKEAALQEMNCEKWLNRLNDYVQSDQINPVPDRLTGYACFRHVKLKGNKEKLARRRAKRIGETLQEALQHFEGFKEQCSKLPYINMKSQTNGQRFRLIIKKQVTNKPKIGFFSCYGLSNKTTVPLF